MKIEVKDLTPYLPYGLKMYHKGVADALKKANQKYNPTTLKMLSRDGSFWVGKESESRNINQDIHKPILRPLSDLTKEILNQWYDGVAENEISMVSYSDDTGNAHTVSVSYKMMGDGFTDIICTRNSIKYTDYWIVQKMLENHFDVFGLIDFGLAIDINKL